MYILNERMLGISCLRCNGTYSAYEEYHTGCPVCLQNGFPVSLQVDYPNSSWAIERQATGMSRYVERLPYLTFPTLGEGNTPLIDFPKGAAELGINSLMIKNEGQNPTGSHKDRMSPFVIARACAQGKSTVALASSGNAGASIAAYAAAGGLKCVVITTADISPIWERAIRSTGAEIVITKTAAERWEFLKEKVEQMNWYPATNFISPPVGSNLYGIQGYKTIAFEIVEKLKDNMPNVVIIPCSRGDLLWGVWKGFCEAKERGWIGVIPRMVSVEPFNRLGNVLEGEDYRKEFPGDAQLIPSIGGGSVTYQLLQAVHSSGGCAIDVSSEESLHEQKTLSHQGFYWERSAATVMAAARKLVKRGIIDKTDKVLLIATSNGYKEMD